MDDDECCLKECCLKAVILSPSPSHLDNIDQQSGISKFNLHTNSGCTNNNQNHLPPESHALISVKLTRTPESSFSPAEMPVISLDGMTLKRTQTHKFLLMIIRKTTHV